jgi:hypothetical protein
MSRPVDWPAVEPVVANSVIEGGRTSASACRPGALRARAIGRWRGPGRGRGARALRASPTRSLAPPASESTFRSMWMKRRLAWLRRSAIGRVLRSRRRVPQPRYRARPPRTRPPAPRGTPVPRSRRSPALAPPPPGGSPQPAGGPGARHVCAARAQPPTVDGAGEPTADVHRRSTPPATPTGVASATYPPMTCVRTSSLLGRSGGGGGGGASSATTVVLAAMSPRRWRLLPNVNSTIAPTM